MISTRQKVRLLPILAMTIGILALAERQANAQIEGTWTTKSPLQTARRQHAGGVIDGKFYVVGGTSVAGEGVLDSLEAYDPSTDTWATLSPMPTPRNRVKAAVLNGQLYVVGGSQGYLNVVSSVEAYDPLSNTWSIKAPLPTPRAWAASAVVDGKLYAIAGNNWGPGNGNVDVVEMYDPNTNTWSTRAPLPSAIRHHNVAVISGKIYVVGDILPFSNPAMYVYDPVANAWETKMGPPVFLTDVGVAVLDGILFVIGGYDQFGVVHNAVWQYDPATETWVAGTPLPDPRLLISAGVIDRVIYAVGGATTGGESVYPVATNEAFKATVIDTYACSPAGFWPPFDVPIGLKKNHNRAIPIKMMLRDSVGNIITNASIVAPVISVEYTPTGGTAVDVTSDLLPLGASNDGNIFRYDPGTLTWIYNLSTTFFDAPGTYRVTARAGDTVYLIGTNCGGTFVRQP